MIEYIFPIYEEGEKIHWDSDNKYYRFFDENDYFKNVNDIIETLEQLPKILYLGNTAYQAGINHDEEINMINSIENLLLVKEQINNAIENKKMVKFVKDVYKLTEANNNKILRFMPTSIRLKYEPIVNELNNNIKINANKNDNFVKTNVIEIFNEIDNRIIILQDKLKESRKNANKKYYEKQKALMNTIKKPTNSKTPEEILEARREANKKYYEKQKALLDTIKKPTNSKTPEEILQARKEANHKFYLKRKEMLKDLKYVPKTDEEKVEAKKDANKKYYEKKKLQRQELPNQEL